MKLNLKVRLKNPIFIMQLLMSVFVPVLAYTGLTLEELTSWVVLIKLLYSAISNPYVLILIGISVFNALNDPTTKGLKDSDNAMTYIEPKK